MVLPPEATARFYRTWFALLHAVNQRLHLVPSLPANPGTATVPTADALQLRNAPWADDGLREGFVADNPAGLPAADLELVASWRYRLAGAFFIERHLKKYTVFLSGTSPAQAYGVLGLVSPLVEIVGPYLPVYAEAVLLPFDGQIIYDCWLRSRLIESEQEPRTTTQSDQSCSQQSGDALRRMRRVAGSSARATSGGQSHAVLWHEGKGIAGPGCPGRQPSG